MYRPLETSWSVLGANAAAGRLLTFLLAVFLTLTLPGCSGGGSNGGGENGGSGPTAPAAPSGLSATSQDGAIDLEWNAVSEADTYRVYRSTNSGVDASGSPLSTDIGSTDYVDESAENGTKYYYVVTAVATEGGDSAESDPSNEVEKTPFSDPPDRP
jgi:hypothetical protein